MIYRALTRTELDGFKLNGTYAPPDLAEEGFIHASGSEEDVLEVLNRCYRDVQGMLVIGIEELHLTSVLKWEKAPDDWKPDRLFPHIYSEIGWECVIRIFEAIRNENRDFTSLSAIL